MPAIRARASLCTVAVLTATVVACSGDARRAPSNDVPDVRIGTFLAEGRSLLANMLSREPLVAVGWDGRPVFRLAESGTEAADGRTLTVKLREGARFHTGEAVTPERVQQMLSSRRDIMAEVSAVDVAADGTLLFTVPRPYSFKLDDLSRFMIYDETNPLLRTGPFKLAGPAPAAVLERFSAYHQGTPTVPRVEIVSYPTHRAAWTAMMRGDVNFLHEINRDAIEFAEAGGGIRAYPLLRPYYVSLLFNVKHPILKRREVRLALNEAVDKEEVVRVGIRGYGQVADGPFWPYHWAYPQTVATRPFNLHAASVRLDAAGLKLESRAPGQMPSRFTFTCLLPEGDTRFERIAIVVQRQLYAIGVDLRFRILPQAEFQRRIGTGDFESFIFEMASGRTLSYPYQFWHSAGHMLTTGYSAADAALDRMKFAASEEETRVSVADVMRIMREDPPAVFLAFPREARAADATLEIPYERDRDVFGSIWQTRRVTPQQASR